MSRLALAVLVPGLFVCVLAAPEAVRPNSKCNGYTLYKDAGGYLMYYEIPVTFDDAKTRCAAEGGVLASPINDGIKAAMLDILWKTRTYKKKNVFTGFSSKPNNGGIFHSIDGTRLSNVEHTWAHDEPNNVDGLEQCIVLSPNGTISDVQCGNRNPYFCFLMEGVEIKTVCSEGYVTLENTTGSCYKYHNNKLVFNDAAKVCEQEGGHLAIINGDNEAQALKKLVDTYFYYAIVGFQLNTNSGKWMTVQGETIEDAGYAKWNYGWNSSSAASKALKTVPVQFVGLIRRDDGLLDYGSPSTTRPFICEKTPEIEVCE